MCADAFHRSSGQTRDIRSICDDRVDTIMYKAFYRVKMIEIRVF